METLINKYKKRIDEIIIYKKALIFGEKWAGLESEKSTLAKVISDLELHNQQSYESGWNDCLKANGIENDGLQFNDKNFR